jgi:hypothetical protein
VIALSVVKIMFVDSRWILHVEKEVHVLGEEKLQFVAANFVHTHDMTCAPQCVDIMTST